MRHSTPLPFDAINPNIFDDTIAEATVRCYRSNRALLELDATLRRVRAALEAQRLDDAAGSLQVVDYSIERMTRCGLLLPPDYLQRWEVLRFAVERGFL